MSSGPQSNRTRVVILTADPAFEKSARAIFGVSSAIDLVIEQGSISGQGDTLSVEGASVVLVDLDAGNDAKMAALSRFMTRLGEWPPVIAATQTFDEGVARTLLQMRIADFLVKPIKPVDPARYRGIWYEIGRYENLFERGCEGVSTDYELRPDGLIQLTNTCRKGSVNAPAQVITGKAKVVNGSANAKMKVSFFGFRVARTLD